MTFVLAYALPSDPARVIAGPGASEADIDRIQAALGLGRPLPVTLLDQAARTLSGDLGHSSNYDRDVLPLLLERLPATMELAIAGLALGSVLGIALGVRAAGRPGRLSDTIAHAGSLALLAVPAFWLGNLLRYGLASMPQIDWGVTLFPIGGYRPLDPWYLALPAATLALGVTAAYARLARVLVRDELASDYVRTARAKGVGQRSVLLRHALPNATPALLAQLGTDFGAFLGGVAIVEQVFDWPGVGRLAVEAIETGDIALIMGTVLFAGFWVIVINVAIDLFLTLWDPRVRLEGG